MDWVFWIGLGLGAAISFPISIIANLQTENVREWFGKRRAIKLSEKKYKEVRTYLYIRALVEGNPVAKVLLDLDTSFVNRIVTISLLPMLCVVPVLVVALQPEMTKYRHFFGFACIALCLISSLSGFVVMSFHFLLSQIRRKVLNFVEYENSIREKWGDDAIEEFLRPQTPEP